MTQSSTLARASELAAAFFAACPTFIAESTGTPVVHEGDVDFQNVAIYPRPAIGVIGLTLHRVIFAEGESEGHTNEGFIMFTIVRDTPGGVLGNPDQTQRDHAEFFGKVIDEFELKAKDGTLGDTLGILALDVIEFGRPDAELFKSVSECFICQGRIHWGYRYGRNR